MSDGRRSIGEAMMAIATLMLFKTNSKGVIIACELLFHASEEMLRSVLTAPCDTAMLLR